MPEIDFTYEDLSEPNYIQEAGSYRVEITRSEFEVNGDKRNFKLVMVTDDGLSHIERVHLTQAAKWRLEQVLKAIGFLDGRDKGFKAKVSEKSFEGGVCWIDLIQEAYKDKEGKDRTILKVKKFRPLEVSEDSIKL